MDTRNSFIERVLRQIYGSQPTDDSSITFNLVNKWLNNAIGIAVKQNYKDNVMLDGVGYVNNSFYTSFKNISVTAGDNFSWIVELPQLPIALGRNEGISILEFRDSNGQLSLPCIPISEN